MEDSNNEDNNCDETTLENGEVEPLEEETEADVGEEEPMECDKMNGNVISLGSPDDQITSVVSPENLPLAKKINKQRKQVLTTANHAKEDNTPTVKPQAKKSKKVKLRHILPVAQVATSNQEDLTDDLISGSTSPPLSCTEYAQYLGLQPTVKFKCFKCSESGFSSINELKEHQSVCLKSSRSNTPDSSTGTHLNNVAQNLRITRKVYMCSSCGTYFENWNLYIHMREVHRRHVCLICLSMFMHAEKLALHLSDKHNTSLEEFTTTDDFLSTYPSSTYLTCCTCERIFSEQDNFFEHDCGDKKRGENGCAMCGVQFAHTQSCPHAEGSDRDKPEDTRNTEEAVSTEPSTSQQVYLESSVEERQPEPDPPSITDSQPVKPPSKPPAKKRVRKKKINNTLSEIHSINTPPSKLKPTCLRIKLAPVSRKSSKKLHESSVHLDESSDVEDLPSPTLDLTEELEMLADDTSNPPTFQNGERSASNSPQPVNDLDSIKNEEHLDTGQSREEVLEVPKEQETPLGGDLKVDACESEPEECRSVSPELQRENQGEQSPKEDTEKEAEAISSMSEHEDTQDQPETKDTMSDHFMNDESLDASENPPSPKLNMKLDQSENEDSLDQNDKSDSIQQIEDSVDHSDTKDNLDFSNSIDKSEPKVLDGDASLDRVSTMDVDSLDGDDKDEWQIDEQSCKEEDETPPANTGEEEEELQLAGEDTPVMDLVLETSIDQQPIQSILKLAIQEACEYSYCVYCTHARRIAVNGKQLAIHLLSEHRFQLVANSERLSCEKFIDHVKENMKELETLYFNCDTYDSSNKENVPTFVKIYECFQCRYVTKVHKDLYLHNRKMHQKNGLVCIMCKSNFYSYSELLCHLCPGIYNNTNQPIFRCCFCSVDDLPSAFRFMVHVRKRHQACDVCLETTHDQQKLSNHVWKHKLHHFCYRCGIAYRNKPDITKHLFWKHGTESVLCKRCLQKKWPYVYHFCIPPTSFTCEECNATFSKAVALKVHKRLHTNELLYPCELCNDSFISRKLLARHDRTIHNPPPPEEIPEQNEQVDVEKISPPEKDDKDVCDAPLVQPEVDTEKEKTAETTNETTETPPEKKTKVVDVYDLPPLNLSSDSESESDTEESKSKTTPQSTEAQKSEDITKDKLSTDTEISQVQENVPQATDSVWENFKDYKSSKDVNNTVEMPSTSSDEPTLPQPTATEMLHCVMFDHDYFGMSEASDSKPETVAIEEVDISGEASTSFEHNYCNNNEDNKTINEEKDTTPKKKQKTPKKKHKSGGESCSSCSDSDSSSSDSSSSSCSCGTNCSCSSSSSSSSGSSSSDSSDSDSSSSEKREKKKAKRRERAKNRKERAEAKAQEITVNGHAEMSTEEPNVEDIGPPVLFFHESDLDTNESETDEDFYDEHPRLLMPNRNLMLLSSAIDSLVSPQATPAPTPPPSEVSDTFPVSNALLAQLAQDESVNETLTTKTPKSKKRKRSLSTPRRGNKLKINLPNLLQTQLQTSPVPKPPVQKKARSKPSLPASNYSQFPMTPSPLTFPTTPYTPQYSEMAYSPAGSSDKRGSGSETDSNVRLSKRKRVPKKFYGDSSDEETQNLSTPTYAYTPQMSQIPAFTAPPPPPLPPPPPPPPLQVAPLIIRPPKKKIKTQPETESMTSHRTPTEADLKLQAVLDFVAAGYDGRTADDEDIYKRLSEREAPKQPKLILTIENHRISAPPVVPPEEVASSSSDESEESEEEEVPQQPPQVHVQQTPMNFLQRPIISNKSNSVKLYCYCQCPYDEVSEMIACDGKNCAIEWFHFECVGITVPPKGKWYCPDCRKRYNMAEPIPNPDFFYNPSSEYMMSTTTDRR